MSQIPLMSYIYNKLYIFLHNIYFCSNSDWISNLKQEHVIHSQTDSIEVITLPIGTRRYVIFDITLCDASMEAGQF